MQSVIRLVAFEFAGGDAFFLGLSLLMTGALVAAWRDGPRIRVGFRLATIGSWIVIAASGTPLPLWFYGVGGLLSVLSFLPRPPATEARRSLRRFRIVVGLLICWCATGAAWEFSYRLPPRLNEQARYEALVVIGDSVSAGLIGKGEQTWPKQFRERFFGSVLDLSAAGATARSALRQAQLVNQRLANREAVVLIEIGGNDYFELVPPADFAEDLDRLLTELERPNRQLVLLELPLPPFYNAYGRLQRDVAARHSIPLVSKREFARVVFAPAATLDTVHLSESGHSLFANMVWQHVGPLLRTSPVDSMTLYSIEEQLKSDREKFHTYIVLGKVDITSPSDRTAIFTAVQQGIDEGYRHPAFGCFEPHHGVRARRNGKTFDYVLCFHCGNVDEFVDDRWVTEETMSWSAQGIIDKHLKAAGVPQSKD
jgi:acyl-CoA thioesterase-1